MRGIAPPSLSQPGVGELFKMTIPAGMFEGTVANWTQRVASAAQSFSALVNLPIISAGSQINLYVLWSTESTTTTDSVTWRLRYAAITPETDATTASVAALDTAIVADTANGTANVLQRTPAGIVQPGSVLEGDLLKLTLDAPTVVGLTLAGTVVNFHAVEIEFIRAVV